MTREELEANYQPLADVLARAWEQCAVGKGAQRHGQDQAFEVQPMLTISDMIGTDAGLIYQAIKKLQESCRMNTDAAIRERLGAINYIAGSIIFKERNHE